MLRAQQAENESLRAQIEQLQSAAGTSSRNSDRPPSKDSDAARAKRKKRSRSARAQGAQPGHKKCWTHLLDARVPLTDNLAERALRPYVIWRKSSYATQSHRGNLSRPMVLSLVQTAQALKVSAFEFLSTIATEHQATGRVTCRLPLGAASQLAGP